MGWFADRSIAQKLSVGFGSIVLLTGVVITVGLVASGRATSSIDRTTEIQAPTSLAASSAQADLLRMIGDVRGYLALGDADYRRDYEVARASFEADLAELDRLASAADPNAPATVILIGRLADLRAAYTQWVAQPVALFDLHDDQLKREPALRILIEDATPRVQRVLVSLAAALQTQTEVPPSAADVAVLTDMADFQSSFLSMLAGLRGYVTTGRDIFKFEYTANATINDTAMARLMAIRDRLQPSQRDQLDAIRADRTEFLNLVPTMFTIVAGPNARADLASFRDHAVPVGDGMLATLTLLASEEQANLRADLGRGRSDLSNAQAQALIGGLGAFLLAVALAFVFRRAIAGPIVRLTRVSEAIREGDLGARATVESGDEIGTLAMTFNGMTARLEQTVGQLNDRNREQAEYIEQVGHVTSAAGAVEADMFEPGTLDGVAARDDALGQLARTFQRMAREVRAREERLRDQVHELRIEIDEARQAKKVAEITDTDFFRGLRSRAAELRRIVDDVDPGNDTNGIDR